ncbi:uPF0182 protein HMPREF0380_00098 [Firmicutes bacterium CAG:238]|nr:uPF0182 protein HMPREF0380_00098 [Firmicutes bacterium CAG:238]
MEKLEKKVSIIILIVVVAASLFLTLVGFISDFMWFKEMGYVAVFFTQLVTQLKVGIPTFIIVTGLVMLYLHHLRKSYFAKIASSEATDMKKLNRTTNWLAVAFGVVATVMSVTNLWFEILKFANSTDFDITDPLFSFDISFYLFKLEFLSQLNEILIGVIVGFVILTIVYYIILMTVRTPDVFKEEPVQGAETAEDSEERYTGNANPFGGNPFGDNPFGGNNANNAKDPFSKIFESLTGKKVNARPIKPKKQFDDGNFRQLMNIASGKITILGFIFFIMLAINFFLRQFDLLHAHTGVVYGAGFTDVNITLWMYRILCGLAILSAIMFIVQMGRKKYKSLLTVPVIMIFVGLVGTGAGMLIQNFVVSPDEINKESQYLERNIQYTQYAYQLDDVDIKAFAADNKLTASDINANVETINNIRINDFDPAQQFYNQTQSIRQYYTFHDVDVDRYMINGKYTQTFLTAREIDENKIDTSWLNRHLKYTHGYGATLSRVDKVTSSGQPDVLIGNIPPESEVKEIKITRPEIYFGELSNEYIVVNTDEKEFDYPDGQSNKYTMYEGKAGIKLNFFNRVLFSIKEGSLKLLVSSNIDSDSKIIIYRNVIDRVRKIMPHLSYEADPYMVAVDGKLYWMMDAYTTSSYYPYSEPIDGNTGSTNYIRNSVKVVVDAYNGDTNFYVVDEKDPIATTFQKIYPTLFKSFDEMPEGLKSHIRYPNYLFEIQASVYAKYHMEDVNVFYQREDMWDIASEIYGMEKKQMTPNYYIAKLPDEQKAEFFNSIPFTPKSKQNMTALMVARNDGENYGQLVLYQFPKSRTIYGPEQIEAQIDQNTEISKEFSLWSSAGTKYRRGNMFIIPINTSILYVEPVYLEATNSSIPEVKRIIVAYNDKIAYEETLADCLISLFGTKAQNGVSGSETTTPSQSGGEDSAANMSARQLAELVQEYFTKAQNAQKNGDWAKYGEYLDKMEEYLNELTK